MENHEINTDIANVRDYLDWVNENSLPQNMGKITDGFKKIALTFWDKIRKKTGSNVLTKDFEKELREYIEKNEKFVETVDITVRKLLLEKVDFIINPLHPTYINRQDIENHFSSTKNQSEYYLQLFFRGQNDAAIANLLPSVYRDNHIEHEHIYFQETLKNKPHEFEKCESVVEQLVLMQHHGIPTRLLDITSNPLVALFFACGQNGSKDGKVFVFLRNIRQNLEAINLFSRFSQIANRKYEVGDLLSALDIKNPSPETFKLFKNDPLLYRAKKTNARIVAQSGEFFIYGANPFSSLKIQPLNDEITKEFLKQNITKWKAPKASILLSPVKTCIIPHKNKANILKELDSLNINFSTLFPDLDGWGSYLKWKYK